VISLLQGNYLALLYRRRKGVLLQNISILKVHLHTLLIICILTSCKKYPENNLWFRSAEGALQGALNGPITKYTVNGIDSLDLLSLYICNCPGVVQDIWQFRFNTSVDHNRRDTEYMGRGGPIHTDFVLKDNNMNLTIGFDNSPTVNFRKNLFISNKITWNILELSTSTIKVGTILENGNAYEIQIHN
jgi:hypothetical protein